MYSLAPYRVAVSNIANGKQIALWNDDGGGFSCWVHSYLEEKLGLLELRPEKRMVRVARIASNSDYTFVCGRLQTGEYGFTSELVNSQLSSVSHERTEIEAEMIPFFFSLSVPKQANWGVLMLQKFKNLGIFDFLVHQMQIDFNKKFGNRRLVVERLVPNTLAKSMLNGATLKALRLVSYTMPKAVEDALGGSYKDKVRTTEVVIKSKREGALPKLGAFMDVLDGKKNLTDVVTLPEWDYNALKLDVEIGGRRRTIDLGKPYKLTPNVDITDTVPAGPDGHPLWNNVVEAAGEYSEDYLSSQYPDVKVDATLTQIKDAPKIASGTVNSIPKRAA